ncbi:uncharacterized protein LOC135492379 isoform X2 [Lineus longissimus]|uniref:uncharacterized protein LOC135492379 isoform X2 n=1 Tax=Lineus longissimus TaxID=88925 RepID=UPI00315D389C
MAEGQDQLEIPKNNDNGVVEAMKFLNRELMTPLMKNYLKEAGEFLYVATNATAKDADQMIKVQSCLFDIVKLCDAWNLMLTSFKIGASDILEKLHIAYLKLLDGFADFALADVQSVTKHVSSMKAACKKAEGSFKTVIRELEDTIGFLEEVDKKNGALKKTNRDEYWIKADRLEEIIKNKIWNEDLETVTKDTDWKILELELEELEVPRDEYHGVSKKIENGLLAKVALTLALPNLKAALEFLVKIEQLADKWYNECKEVVEKNMKANVKQAGKLSEDKQKEFWKPLVFVETAYNFLCRWKALQQICLSTISHMRRVRGDIDWYYTENLYPSEAVEKAWALREKIEELKKQVKPRKQNNVVPDHDRVEALHLLQKLFEMALQIGEGTQHADGGYMQKLEIIGSYLWFLGHISPGQEIRTTKGRTGTVCSDLLEGAGKLRTDTVSEFASGYIGCKHALDDIPCRSKSKTSGNDQIEEIVSKLSDNVKSLNGSDLKSIEDQFNTLLTNGWRQVEKDIKTEECTAVSAAEDSTKGSVLGGITRLAKDSFAKVFPGQKKTDAGAESIKKYQLSVTITQEIQKQLPLEDLSRVYSEMFGSLETLSSNMRNELPNVEGENVVQERSPEWQDGVLSNLMGFIVLYSTNTRQLKNVPQLIDRGKINKQATDGISWTALKRLVNTDEFLRSKALAIDDKVDVEVTDMRRSERNKEQERRRVDKEKQVREREEEQERKNEMKQQTSVGVGNQNRAYAGTSNTQESLHLQGLRKHKVTENETVSGAQSPGESGSATEEADETQESARSRREAGGNKIPRGMERCEVPEIRPREPAKY